MVSALHVSAFLNRMLHILGHYCRYQFGSFSYFIGHVEVLSRVMMAIGDKMYLALTMYKENFKNTTAALIGKI